jgi:hypothetical protein
MVIRKGSKVGLIYPLFKTRVDLTNSQNESFVSILLVAELICARPILVFNSFLLLN